MEGIFIMRIQFLLFQLLIGVSLSAEVNTAVQAKVAGYAVAQAFIQHKQRAQQIIDAHFKQVLIDAADSILRSTAACINEMIVIGDLNAEIAACMQDEISTIKRALLKLPIAVDINDDPRDVFGQAWYNEFGTEFDEQQDLPCLVNFFMGITDVISITDIDWYAKYKEMVYGSEGKTVLLQRFNVWMTLFFDVFSQQLEQVVKN